MPGITNTATGAGTNPPNQRSTTHLGRQARSEAPTLALRPGAVTRLSLSLTLSEAPVILLAPPVPQSPSIRRAPPHTPAPAAPGRDPAREKMIENLTARVNQLELTAEELRNELRIAQSENQRKVADLAALVEKNGRKHEEDLKKVLSMNKCQLESQRLEFKEEIRKLLSFKDVSLRPKDKNGDKNVAQTDTFKNTSDRLLNKIHRLSARMSLQDSDMKELIQVKSSNEKKLDSAKKKPVGKVLNVPDLQSCISQSEPDLASM